MEFVGENYELLVLVDKELQTDGCSSGTTEEV
jgi:hypothetical protein